MFLLVRQVGVVFVMFGGQDAVMNQFGDVPVRVTPVPVVKGASVLRKTFQVFQFCDEGEGYGVAVQANGDAAVAVNLLRVIIVLLSGGFVVNGRFTVMFCKDRVN